jgi:hypothetical protein
MCVPLYYYTLPRRFDIFFMYISMVWTEMMTFGPRLFSLLFSIILYDTLIILSLSRSDR